jgi:hypothetical protein
MNRNHDNRKLPVIQSTQLMKNPFPGYPASPAGEDIYNKYLEEKDIDPENVAATKDLNVVVQDDSNNETSDVSGSDLDVPGSELDDKMEAIGSEDEENNYYSLGGDDHNDLDEDKGI